MWKMLKKFAPVAILAGYAVPYSSKGWDRVVIDLRSITVEKLTAKWQNLAIAAAASGVLYFIRGARIPNELKVLIMIGMYFLIGLNLAYAIDPPVGVARNTSVAFVPPARLNPYALAGR
jgi:hypothetical protein